jgi:NOL1/NOP2/sun family putative RNA methylase
MFYQKDYMEISERHAKILGDGFDYRFDSQLWTLRVNTIKSSKTEISDLFKDRSYRFENVPWCKEGFWIWTDDILTKTKEYSNGLIISQNSSSMLPPMILDPKEGELVLDMAASPGSKTTQMAAMMRNRGAIIANDVDKRRLTALRSNLDRCGVMNTVLIIGRGEDIWKSGLKFDKILLDAPCTGTGTMNPRILSSTRENLIKSFSRRQKEMIESAFKSLKEGGMLVYSTCSLEPEENEAIVNFAIEKLGMKTVKQKLNVPSDLSMEPLIEWKDEIFDSSVSNAVRIVPSARTEGFFACALSL